MAGRLGDILVNRGHLTTAQLEGALASQGSERGMLGAILLRRGLVTHDQLGSALAEQFEVPFRAIVPETINPQAGDDGAGRHRNDLGGGTDHRLSD
jgi:hypothetical protein